MTKTTENYADREHATRPIGPGELVSWKTRAKKLGLPKPPSAPIPAIEPDRTRIAAHAGSSAAPLATWIGHASVLLQFSGLAMATDPVFSGRCSPLQFAGPKRAQPPALSPAELPRLDAVLVSHDHYDHLDEASVKALGAQPGGSPLFVVPLGLKSWLAKRGIERCVELDWWETTSLPSRDGPVEIMLAPAQHWSARGVHDRHSTLWGSFCVLGEAFHGYFAGDTAHSNHFEKIANHLADRQTPALGGGFDLALLPIGAYEPRRFMKAQHINPDESCQAHKALRAKQSLAIHWGSFELTDESLDEPPRELARQRIAHGIAEADFPHIAVGASLEVPDRRT